MLSLREKEFVEASRSLGRLEHAHHVPRDPAEPRRADHRLRSLLIPQNILFEAALSFLGVGVKPPTASWGQMISDATPTTRHRLVVHAVPGVALLLTVLAFNLVGDGLQDALNPKADR